MVENRNATQNNPPTRRRDSSAVGSKAKLKITTTSTAKNSMELNTSRERHSRRMSLPTCAEVSRSSETLMPSPAERCCGLQAVRQKEKGISRQYWRVVPTGE